MTDWIDQLSELRGLRTAGAIDDAEFEARRTRLFTDRDASACDAATPKQNEPCQKPFVVDTPAVAPVSGPNTELTQLGGSSLVPVSGTPPLEPLAPAPPMAAAVAPRSAGTGVPAWVLPTIGGVVAIALIGGIASMLQHGTAAKPPYPITVYAAPREEQVLAVGLNVRSGPGAAYPTSAAEPLKMGQSLSAIGEIAAKDGGRWAYVKLSDGSRGYVNARLLGVPQSVSSAEFNRVPLSAIGAQEQIEAYWRDWSAADDRSGAGIDSAYAERVDFYGKTLPRATVLDQKHAFARRWPTRSYAIRPGSLSTSCADGLRCRVVGIVDWSCADHESGRTASGVARFVFDIEKDHLVAESGSVLNRL